MAFAMSPDYYQNIMNIVGQYDNDNGDRYAQVLVGAAATPRRLPTTTLDDNAFDYWGSFSDDAGVPSEYTVTPADTSSIYSGRTSASSASYASTIFSQISARTSAGVSSRPPRAPAAHLPTFMETMQQTELAAEYATPNHHAAGANPISAGSHPLWCEFRNVQNCDAVFRIDHTNEWIEHHERHLNDQYPNQVVCWFCDHVPFKTTGRSQPYSNFVDRMEHIREHIRGEYKTASMMRPDFWMINHMRDNGLISESKYHAAIGHNELPHALRQPGSSSSSSSFQHPETRRPPGPGLAHDLAREKRLQRPRGSGSPHPPKVPKHHRPGQ